MRDFGFLRFFLLLFCAHFTICRISAGLLSTAQFVKKNAFTPVYCCYTKHILRKAVFFHSLLLRSAQFFRMQGAVVIGSTIPVCRIFSSRVVKRSTFFAERLFHISIVTESTIQKNSFLWLLYLTLFKNPTQNCDRRIFAQKIFFCVVTAGTL